jgi:hypothetical protein
MAKPDSAGEFAFIKSIREREQTRTGSPWTRLGIGDDCAILDVGPGSELFVTTEILMDGRHFQLELGGLPSAKLPGRRPHPPFRGLLDVHSRYGLPARRAARIRAFLSKTPTVSLPPPPLR